MGRAPVGDVAKAIVNHIKDASIQTALLEAGMDFEVLIQNRLGVWAKQHADNEAYIQTLIKEVEKELKAAGLIPDDEDEGQAEQQEEGEEENE